MATLHRESNNSSAWTPWCHMSCDDAVSVNNVLKLFPLRLQNPNSMGWVALDACLLIMFLVVIRFLTYVALRHKTAAK